MPVVCPDYWAAPCSMRLAASARSDSLIMLWRAKCASGFVTGCGETFLELDPTRFDSLGDQVRLKAGLLSRPDVRRWCHDAIAPSCRLCRDFLLFCGPSHRANAARGTGRIGWFVGTSRISSWLFSLGLEPSPNVFWQLSRSSPYQPLTELVFSCQ